MCFAPKSQNENGVDSPQSGGESEIRTRERLAPSTVFKTVAINRSAISPIIFQHTLRNSVPTTVCGSTAAPTRLARRSPLHSDAKTVAINRSAISPIIFQHTLRNSVPTTVCGSTAAPDAPCSPISASLRCQDLCNQPLSFKTTGAVLVCTQNSPKGQEFFKNYLRLPIRRR